MYERCYLYAFHLYQQMRFIMKKMIYLTLQHLNITTHDFKI
jgi:hypothetical protein